MILARIGIGDLGSRAAGDGGHPRTKVAVRSGEHAAQDVLTQLGLPLARPRLDRLYKNLYSDDVE